MAKVSAGSLVAPRQVQDSEGRELRLPLVDGLTHLQVRRFAGCPICARHLAPFASRRAEIEAAGVTEVVVFKSTPEQVRRHESGLPLITLADPDGRWYDELDVRSTVRSLLHPKAVVDFLAEVVAHRSLRGSLSLGDHLGLPADVLLDANGYVLDAHYGEHAADGWTVDDVLRRAGGLT